MPPVLLPQLTLVLGGARSGKSRYAEELFTGTPPPWTYIATAQAFDDEMAAKISAHRSGRGGEWRTIESPLDVGEAIAGLTPATGPALVDCLTLWLSNVMLEGRDVEAACAALVATLSAARVPVVMVSNEVGLSIVPENRLARRFRDAQGQLNQNAAAVADRVIFVAAGLPLTLKDNGKTDG